MGRPHARTFDRYDRREIWQKDKDHYVHPWPAFESAEEGCLVTAESEGAYVYDADGRRYLDGIAGIWCVNVGYANEEMVAAIADQARRLAYHSPFTDATTAPAALLAAKLAETAPRITESGVLLDGRFHGEQHRGADHPFLQPPSWQARKRSTSSRFVTPIAAVRFSLSL